MPKNRKALANKLQKAVNLYARMRDCYGHGWGANCISCGEWHSFNEMDGGHFIPTTSSATRYDERNVNAQCRQCNRFLHGNQRHYYKAMIAKWGQAVVDELESKEFLIKKWEYEELLELYNYYQAKIKELR